MFLTYTADAALSPTNNTAKPGTISEDFSESILGLIDVINWIKRNNYEKDILPFTVVHDSIVSEVKNELVDEYVENVKKCIQKERGLSISNCPIKVDFEIGSNWGELSEYG